MATPKRYGVFCNRTHSEVHGTGARSKEEMEQWIRDHCDGGMRFYHVGIVEVKADDTDIVACAA